MVLTWKFFHLEIKNRDTQNHEGVVNEVEMSDGIKRERRTETEMKRIRELATVGKIVVSLDKQKPYTNRAST
jgi:hypothetical protein